VVLAEPERATSAMVDLATRTALLQAPSTREVLGKTLPYAVLGRQDVPSEANAHSARDGICVEGRAGQGRRKSDHAGACVMAHAPPPVVQLRNCS
jgi:hypothetical protein